LSCHYPTWRRAARRCTLRTSSSFWRVTVKGVNGTRLPVNPTRNYSLISDSDLKSRIQISTGSGSDHCIILWSYIGSDSDIIDIQPVNPKPDLNVYKRQEFPRIPIPTLISQPTFLIEVAAAPSSSSLSQKFSRSLHLLYFLEKEKIKIS